MNNDSTLKNDIEFFSKVELVLQNAEKHHRLYLANRNYENALLIYSINEELINLLNDLKKLTPIEIKLEINKLIKHINSWLSAFNIHKLKLPHNQNYFHFTYKNRFPKGAELAIVQYIQKCTVEDVKKIK